MQLRTEYKANFRGWLNNELECQQLAISNTFHWDWFVTLTSKETMTLNGARLAMTRWVSIVTLDLKAPITQVFWVAEKHTKGKKGYHIHALIEGGWPKRRNWVPGAQLMDDAYQRAMGISFEGEDLDGRPIYLDRFGRRTIKHRFRAEPYAKELGEYAAKYVTKDASLWEYAHINVQELHINSSTYLSGSAAALEPLGDEPCSLTKRELRKRTHTIRREREAADRERIGTNGELLKSSAHRYAVFSKLRAPNANDLILEAEFKPDGRSRLAGYSGQHYL